MFRARRNNFLLSAARFGSLGCFTAPTATLLSTSASSTFVASSAPSAAAAEPAPAAPAAGPQQPQLKYHPVPTKTAYHPTEIQSAYQLLRLLLRSAELKIKSRQGRKFFKRRAVDQWRIGREETDPVKQRAYMERAAAALHALHVKGSNPNPSEPIEIDLSSARFGAAPSVAAVAEGKGAVTKE